LPVESVEKSPAGDVKVQLVDGTQLPLKNAADPEPSTTTTPPSVWG
jgi:hypothetical protein